MLIKYDIAQLDFVNTSEAYSKSVLIGNSNVVIPYVNIGLMSNNPINKKQSVIDYSYYVFTNVQSIAFGAGKSSFFINLKKATNHHNIVEYIIIGGFDEYDGAEVKISCELLSLYILETAKISDSFHPFIPINTPNFEKNLYSQQVEFFFSISGLPNEIKEILGINFYSLYFDKPFSF